MNIIQKYADLVPADVWVYLFSSLSSTSKKLFLYSMYSDPNTSTKTEYSFLDLHGGTELYSIPTTARLFLGGDRQPPYSGNYHSCFCELQKFRIIRDLYFSDVSLMDSFSGYTNRNPIHHSISSQQSIQFRKYLQFQSHTILPSKSICWR